MTKKYVITKEKMQEGIKICFNKACLLIDSAESLLKHRQSPDVVIGLITIALEEFGKGLLLKDYLNCDKSEYEIPIELFKTPKSHFKKINRGLEEIPTEHRYIYPPLLIKLFSHSDIKIIINGNRMNVSIPKNLEKQFKNFDTNEVTFLSKYTPKIKNRSLMSNVLGNNNFNKLELVNC